MYQARCLLCDWAGEITGNKTEAADDAREHRSGEEHRQAVREARKNG
jgi:hypothetical protein